MRIKIGNAPAAAARSMNPRGTIAQMGYRAASYEISAAISIMMSMPITMVSIYGTAAVGATVTERLRA